MDSFALPITAMVVGILGFLQLAWHVAVIVFVYRIWQKVKHLPG
jgi:hypothetical protein